MRILITGGCGYIGSHVVRTLQSAGNDIFVYDNLLRGRREAVGNTGLAVADINDTDTLERVFRNQRFDMVIHLAALIDPETSMKQPLDYYRTNVGGTLTLLEHCMRHSVRYFIFSSTAAVYATDSTITNDMAIDENAELEPISIYGRTKLIAEQAITDCARESGMRYIIFRYYNVAGADGDGDLGEMPGSRHLIPRTVTAAVDNGELTIYGTDYATPDGTCIRDYVHVSDLAGAHVLAADYLRNGGEADIFNCGSQHGYSVREVVEEVKKVTGRDFAVRHGTRREGDPDRLVADTTRIREILNWRPDYNSLSDMITTHAGWRQGAIYQSISGSV